MGREANRDRGDDRAFTEGYDPTRPARLRPVDEPPPLPRRADPAAFGTDDEDGLRMLAALETLTSLEPDYATDDPDAEASVTIIEAAGDDVVAGALAGDLAEVRLYRARPHEFDHPPTLLLNGYETFVGTGEEAEVEIVEVGQPLEQPEPATAPRPSHATSLAERLAAATGKDAAGRRFLKALSGEG